MHVNQFPNAGGRLRDALQEQDANMALVREWGYPMPQGTVGRTETERLLLVTAQRYRALRACHEQAAVEVNAGAPCEEELFDSPDTVMQALSEAVADLAGIAWEFAWAIAHAINDAVPG